MLIIQMYAHPEEVEGWNFVNNNNREMGLRYKIIMIFIQKMLNVNEMLVFHLV